MVTQKSSRGFKLPNYWISSYKQHTNTQLPAISEGGKKRMNMQFRLIKDLYKGPFMGEWRPVTTDDLMLVIDYMFYHNPLNYSNLNQYQLTVPIFMKSMILFQDWYSQNKDLITRRGGNVKMVLGITAASRKVYSDDQLNEIQMLTASTSKDLWSTVLKGLK